MKKACEQLFSSAELNAACLKTQPGSYTCRASHRYLRGAETLPEMGAQSGGTNALGTAPRSLPVLPVPPALRQGWRRLRCSERCAVTHFPAVFLHSDRGPSRTSITLQLAGFSISYCSTGRMRLAFPHAHTARCDTHAHVKRTNPRRGGMGTTTRLPSHLQEFS